MELGPRLKQARLEAGLSQRQLCGDQLTRNMLSLIENGTARPSMDTLLYLAARLGKPVSFFLEEESVSPNQARISTARRFYTEGDPTGALNVLESWEPPDPVFDAERYYLEALCCLALFERDPKAPLLEQAAQAGSRTPYYTRDTERRRLLLLARIQPDRAAAIAARLPAAAEELLLRGDAAMAAGDPRTALKWYTPAETVDPEKTWPRLENCYRTLEDYKQAYHYACLQRK